MDNFRFYSPTEFIFGRDTQKETGKMTANYGGVKVLVVYGGQSAEKSGLVKQVTDSLDNNKISYCILKGVQPNPTDDRVYEGIGMALSLIHI